MRFFDIVDVDGDVVVVGGVVVVVVVVVIIYCHFLDWVVGDCSCQWMLLIS